MELYSQTPGEYVADVSELSARLIMDRCPDKFFIFEESEQVDLNEIAYMGIDLAIGGTCNE